MSPQISKIIIVGKGSRLFQKLKHIAEFEFSELSTQEALAQHENFDENCLLIIFSLFDYDEMKGFLTKTKSRTITVGSVSALSVVGKRFKYSALKKRQLNAIMEMNDERHKVILFGDFSKSFIGDYYLSDQKDFWQNVKNVSVSRQICVLCASLITNGDFASKYLSYLERPQPQFLHS